MGKEAHEDNFWSMCPQCQGRGKKSQRLRKKVRLRYQKELLAFEKSIEKGTAPIRPKGHLGVCTHCNGTGLIQTASFPKPDEKNLPHIAIIGGGIGGVALAVACLHHGIPFTLYERDQNFEARSQGYGLTLQQASKAIQGLGIFSLTDGIVSTRHLVHNTVGKILGEWGMRKWLKQEAKSKPRRNNIHIARQALRLALIKQLGSTDYIKWGHQLVSFEEGFPGPAILEFSVNGKPKTTKADLIVGADGIRSTVRQTFIGENSTPLRYLDCIVILGICPYAALSDSKSELLDGATVFQTANGNERIYMMPFDAESIMWQLSFPLSEKEAKELSNKGKEALKEEACKRTQWHHPIPEIMAATPSSNVSGYPVYDREPLNSSHFEKGLQTTLLGDAAHPMSPFKGQGANQALLDALSLAREISLNCREHSNWRELGIRKSVLNRFEKEMLERSKIKVKDSAEAAQFLHSDIVLREMNAPRGKDLK